jgi:flagellar protein FliO/FliZ
MRYSLIRHTGIGFCGLALSLHPFSSFAQATTTDAPPGVTGTAMLQMMLGLMLIVSILFLGAYFLRKLNGGRTFGNTGPLKIVGGLMISPRERVVLIEVEDTWIVVGIVPGQIKTLHTLSKGEIPPASESKLPFGDWLKQITERNNEKK